MSFTQNDDNLAWSHTFGFGVNLGAKGSVRVSNDIRNALNKGFGGGNRWSDSNSGSLSIAVPLADPVDFNVNVSLRRSSDNFGGSRRPLETKDYGAGFTLRPFASFGDVSFRQTLGGQLDQRLGRRDTGLSFSSSLDIKPKALERQNVSFQWGRSGNSSARSATTTTVAGRGKLEAGGLASLSGSFSGRLSSLKRVSTIDSTLQDHLESGRSYHLDATPVESAQPWRLSLDFSENRTEDDGNDDPRDRARFQKNQVARSFKLSADNRAKLLGTAVGYGLDYAVEDKEVDDPLLDRRTVDLTAKATVRLGESEDGEKDPGLGRNGSWAVSSSVRKLQIDTPKGVINDKDEWRGTLSLTYSRHLASGVKLSVPLSTSQSHSVNLNARESANNRWSRVYAIRPKINFKASPAVDLEQEVQLSVNRADFDFDDADNPRSDIIRKFAVDNALAWKVSDKLSARFRYELQLQDSGNLFPGGFQRVDEERLWQTLSLGVNYPWSSAVNISPTFEYRRNHDWQPATGRDRRLDVDKNLTVNVTYSPASSNRITFGGTRSIRNGLRERGRVRDRINATFGRTF